MHSRGGWLTQAAPLPITVVQERGFEVPATKTLAQLYQRDEDQLNARGKGGVFGILRDLGDHTPDAAKLKDVQSDGHLGESSLAGNSLSHKKLSRSTQGVTVPKDLIRDATSRPSKALRAYSNWRHL